MVHRGKGGKEEQGIEGEKKKGRLERKVESEDRGWLARWLEAQGGQKEDWEVVFIKG